MQLVFKACITATVVTSNTLDATNPTETTVSSPVDETSVAVNFARRTLIADSITQSNTQRPSDAATIKTIAHAGMLTFGKYLTRKTDADAFILGFGLSDEEAPRSYFPFVKHYMPIFAQQDGGSVKLMTKYPASTELTTFTKIPGTLAAAGCRIHQWGTLDKWVLFVDSDDYKNPIYDCKEKKWVESENDKVQYNAAVSVTPERSLLVIGGRVTTAITLFKSIPDHPGFLSVPLPPLTQLLQWPVHGILTLDNVETLIVAGGIDEEGRCERINVNIPDGAEWTRCDDLPYPAYSLSSIVWNDIIVTILYRKNELIEIFSYDGSVWEEVMDGLKQLPDKEKLSLTSLLYLKNTNDLCVTTCDDHEFCLKEVGGNWISQGIENNDYGVLLIGSLNFDDMQQCFPLPYESDIDTAEGF